MLSTQRKGLNILGISYIYNNTDWLFIAILTIRINHITTFTYINYISTTGTQIKGGYLNVGGKYELGMLSIK